MWPLMGEIKTLVHEVQFSDLDVNRHVNNVTFVRLFQDTRVRLVAPLRQYVNAKDYTFVVAKIEMIYLKQVFPGSRLLNKVSFGAISRKSVVVEYESCLQDSNVVVCRGSAVMCFVDNNTGKAVEVSKLDGIYQHLKRQGARDISKL